MKDLKKVNNKKLKSQIKNVILELENNEEVSDIQNVKKLKGFSGVYRIRIGDYRLGFYYEHDVVELARFVKRENIYIVFP